MCCCFRSVWNHGGLNIMDLFWWYVFVFLVFFILGSLAIKNIKKELKNTVEIKIVKKETDQEKWKGEHGIMSNLKEGYKEGRKRK